MNHKDNNRRLYESKPTLAQLKATEGLIAIERNATIERCAQVVEESFTPFSLESLAAAIRALKDK